LFLILNLFYSNNLKIDASSDTLILQNDESFQYFEYYNQIFPSKNFLVLAIQSNKKIEENYIKNINLIQNKLNKIEGVESTFSIVDTPILLLNNITLTDLGNKNILTINNSKNDLDLILNEFSSSPIFNNQIINEEQTVSSIIIYLKKDSIFNEIKKKRKKIILKKNLFKNKIVFHAFPSLEAQVAAISDDIAYNNHDLEDGLRAGLFTIEKFNSIPFVSKLINKHVNNTKNFRREIIINQIVRELINVMVVDVINTTNRNLKKYNPQSIKDIYKLDHLIVDFSDKMKKADMQIKNFLKHNMYNHKKVIINTNKGKRIIKVLFNYLSKNPKKYINDELLKKETKERAVADFIAGMTDRYAINLYKKIK